MPCPSYLNSFSRSESAPDTKCFMQNPPLSTLGLIDTRRAKFSCFFVVIRRCFWVFIYILYIKNVKSNFCTGWIFKFPRFAGHGKPFLKVSCWIFCCVLASPPHTRIQHIPQYQSMCQVDSQT